MKILLVASEACPFIDSSRLGEVMRSLPKELNKRDIDVRVIIPKYKNIKCSLVDNLSFLKWFIVKVGWRKQYCGIFESSYGNVTYYFLDNEYYFNRDSQYGYYDDAERFAFFDRAVLEFIQEIEWKPDVIHCNDWQTGMIPVLLKEEYINKDFYKYIKTIFSVHDISLQGIYDKKILPELFGYDMKLYEEGRIVLDDGISFMKGGIGYSNVISTISSSYAEEIGQGLDEVITRKKIDLRLILNGLDYDEYNPFKDSLIFKKYKNNIFIDKKENKMKLQSELGLPIDPDIPMVAIISSLTNEKGIDLVVNIIDRLLRNNLQLVILGTGKRYYEDHFYDFKYRYKDKLSVNIRVDNTLEHKLYAGSDMFLMPSLVESSGLEQLVALRYGSIPIVRETGVLKDTIYPFNKYNGGGNGFSFKNFNSNELLMIIDYALEVFKDKGQWSSIVSQAMNSYNSWEKSANEYIKLYEDVVGV